jgi:hypothetical protein
MTTQSGDLADLHYGQAVAIRSGKAFVGLSYATPSRVDVLSLTASGWVRTQQIQSPDASPLARFGQTIAFRDGTLVVGSQAAAYVYRRADGVWKLRQTLQLKAAQGQFYSVLSMWYEAGELVIGAGGSAYVFETDSSGKFVQRARLQPANADAHDHFGSSVATTAGRMIVVGAPGEGLQNPPRDSAYVFRRDASHRWVQTQKLVPIDEVRWQEFGAAVAMDNGMILVGAPLADGEGGPIGPPTQDNHIAQGSVYGYLPTSGQYVETFKLHPRPDELFIYGGFGGQIAMFGKRIAVAAYDVLPGGGGDHAPSAFVFTYSRTGNDVASLGLALPGPETASTSLSIANRWLLVGSPFKNCSSTGCPGQANLFDLLRFDPW